MQLAVWREKPGDEEMLTVAAKRAFDEKDPVARANLLNEAAIMTVRCPPFLGAGAQGRRRLMTRKAYKAWW